MYSIVLMMAMTSPADDVAFGRRGGSCDGGAAYACTGGGYGHSAGSSCDGGRGGFLGLRAKLAGRGGSSCHGVDAYAGCHGGGGYSAGCDGGHARGGFLGLGLCGKKRDHGCSGGHSCGGYNSCNTCGHSNSCCHQSSCGCCGVAPAQSCCNTHVVATCGCCGSAAMSMGGVPMAAPAIGAGGGGAPVKMPEPPAKKPE